MTNEDAQVNLNRLLEMLKGVDDDALAAIRELEALNYTSKAILRQLEILAAQRTGDVRAAALHALGLKTNQTAAANISVLNRTARTLILREIDSWVEDGLIETDRAEVLERRYDFDMVTPSKSLGSIEQISETNAGSIAPRAAPPPPAAPKPNEPRPGLAQVLLSENSIRVYLYLGAFFVIASAAILAAIIESARLPILLIATLIFAGGAVGLKKRLPQPSFALAVVFSFLLPIDANVVADSFNLTGRVNDIYWAGVFIFMALIWGFGIWLYESRMFSLAAYTAFMFGVLRFANALTLSDHITSLILAVTALASLIFIQSLLRWRGRAFAMPVFLISQLIFGIILIASLIDLIQQLDNPGTSPGFWLAQTAIGLISASFFAASHLLIPFPLFPWMSAASLFLLPGLFLSAFDTTSFGNMIGFGVWGALMVFASEGAYRINKNAIREYGFPWLSLSAPLFMVAFALGINQDTTNGFSVLVGIGLVYTLANILRPRWYVWSAALLAWLSAYFLFFELPIMAGTEVYVGYQSLIAGVLLLVPELFSKEPLTSTRTWNWPPVFLGTLFAGINLLAAISSSFEGGIAYQQSAVIMGVYAILFTAHAIHFKEPRMGYLATSSFALAVIFSLNYFKLDLWLPVLTLLSVLYYFAGYLLHPKEVNRAWGNILINSGLALGTIFSATALFTIKYTGGWYALAIGLLFLIEMYTRRNAYLEMFVHALLGISVILILGDFKVNDFAYYPFALSLLWLASDMAFHLLYKERKVAVIPKFIGGLAVVIFVGGTLLSRELASLPAAICFIVYTIFFFVYALAFNAPILAYLSTTSAVAALYFALDHFRVEQWLPAFIALATAYYIVGFILRRKGSAWSDTIRLSGLGLGTLVALLAPAQDGGIEKAIPIAAAATLFAVEAFATRNVWLAFPANGLYLISYFTLLVELNVDQPQYFSIGAAVLGMLMHYLLIRTGSRTGAFLMGTVSQLALLGTSYVQMVSTSQLSYFFVLFFQSLVIILYGLYMRSRSLVFAPIGIVVLAILTILYNALQNLSLVIIIGVSGLILLTLGILAVLMRERITSFVERFNDWNA